MMMMLRVSVEPGHRPGMAGFGDDAEAHEHVEHAIDRRPRYPRNPTQDLFIYLVGSGMVVATKHCFENCPPLNRHGEPPGATELLEPLKLFLAAASLLNHTRW